jgi:uncharacterized protein (TIGR02147 family)
MKSLFAYFDYQEFLRDFYEEKKRDNPYVSFRYLGHRLRLDLGFLLKVMQGRHHVAPRSVPLLCAFFKFSPDESRYFDMLVRYNKAKTPSEIKLYFEQLISLRACRARPVEEFQYAFYQKWYHSAIHALLSIYEFKAGFKKLASLLTPSITAKQAQESVRLLTRIGMIKRGEDGVYRPADSFVTSGVRWQSVAIRDYQRETINLSAQSIDRHPKEIRDISTITVALSSKDLPEIRERVRQLRQSILTMENAHGADTVYQINIQVIPLTRPIGENP